jgi:hypothetical protein
VSDLLDDGTAGTLIGRCWLPGERAASSSMPCEAETVADMRRSWKATRS